MDKNMLRQQLASKDLSETLSFLAKNIGDDTKYYMHIVNLTVREKELRKSVVTGVIDPREAEERKVELWHRTMKLVDEIQAKEDSNILDFKLNSKENFEEFIKIENNKIELLQQLSSKESKLSREIFFNKSMLEASYQVLRSSREKSKNNKEKIVRSTLLQRIVHIWRKEISVLLTLMLVISIYLLIDFSIMTISQSGRESMVEQYVMLLPIIIFVSVIGLVSLRGKKTTSDEYLKNLESRAELLLAKFESVSPFLLENQIEKNG